MEKSLEFVTRHYRRGAFRPTTVFVKVGRRRPAAVAASVAGAVLVAAAFVYTLTKPETPVTEPAPVENVTTPPATTVAPGHVVKRIEFVDAPLAEVVHSVEQTYGVMVTGLDPNDATRLTLSYEGNAEDLIDTINELTGAHLQIIITPTTNQ